MFLLTVCIHQFVPWNKIDQIYIIKSKMNLLLIYRISLTKQMLEKEATATLAILFHCLIYMLGGHPAKDKASK